MDKIQELNSLRAKYNALMENKVRLEEKLSLLKKERNEVLEKLKNLGLQNIDIDAYLVEAESKLDQVRSKIKNFEMSLDKML